MRHISWASSKLIVAAALLLAGPAAAADDLCGRPREAPQALYERLTKTEKLGEQFRDKAYAVLTDAAKGTIWTFTVAGHLAHPSVVCRQLVQDGDAFRIEMGVQCNAGEAECEKLVLAFEDLNQKMLEGLKELKKQK